MNEPSTMPILIQDHVSDESCITVAGPCINKEKEVPTKHSVVDVCAVYTHILQVLQLGDQQGSSLLERPFLECDIQYSSRASC